MKRQIKFRGKDEFGNWCYGHLVDYDDDGMEIQGYDIYQDGNEEWKSRAVDPDTVGQFTGLYDSVGNEIYEGDILRFGNSPSGICEAKWNESIAAFCIRFSFENKLGCRPLGNWVKCERSIEIIGNIHDNPELLKGGEE